ncbi:hypothetical protein [Rhodococcus jostii]|uniref:hypothetical protein n=1 Tax=Rhodococcus jostii TaxID=132919 RepID=UPI0036643B05
MIEEHVLPRLAAAGVRLVQVARERRHVTKAGDGVVILDDSRAPTQLYTDGACTLYDEMVEAGTIPQSGNRHCSIHAKGDALDPVIARLTRGQPYRHVMGFEAGERRRAEKDAGYNTDLRTGVYPLIEWGWFRDDAVAYIDSVIQAEVGKSACTFCPFAFANMTSRREVFARYTDDPGVGAQTLLMEHLALALNPAQGLVGGRRLVDMIRDQKLAGVLDSFDQLLSEQMHAVYDVRRILRPRKSDPAKLGNAARSVRARMRGTREDMDAILARLAAEERAQGVLEREVGEDGIVRLYKHRRDSTFPTIERHFVVAPALAIAKEHTRFDQWWEDALAAGATARVAA